VTRPTPEARFDPMIPAGSIRPRRILLLCLAAAGLILAACLGDSWTFAHLSVPRVYDQGWGRLLRTLGYLPLWLLVGLAFHRSTTTPVGRRHAWLLMVAPTLSGALSEVLKLLIRRERPGPNAGAYVFRSFSDRPFSTSGLGMPSGDAIVAITACVILARAWPRARFIWYALAVACALARVVSRAHFLSDVTVAGILGWSVAEILWRRWGSTDA
jgi:membrane-associated phospholipid phosphatase